MNQARKQEMMQKAEQVIQDVHQHLPDVWLGGRQRYVLAEAIQVALEHVEREVWRKAATQYIHWKNSPRMDGKEFHEVCREQGGA